MSHRHTLPLLLSTLTVLSFAFGAAPAHAVAQASLQGDTTRRPIPYPVTPPRDFQRAVAQGTRSLTGAPGPSYWQQWTDYTIHARLDTAAKRLDGTVRILYHNNSPRPLPVLWLQILQNHHKEGMVRNRPAEITGGMEIKSVVIGTDTLAESDQGGRSTYRTNGTEMVLQLPRALQPRDSIGVEIGYGFKIPQSGVGGRMGWSRDDLFYLAYWYPQMAVYDDVVGWQIDQFLGTAEFYMGYGDYDVTLDVPQGWLVVGTGTLANASEMLPPAVLDRLHRAAASDTVVHVLTPDDFGPGKETRTAPSGVLSWHYVADVAYSVTRESRWDAARTPVGDRNGDGRTDYARVDAIWRVTAPLWANAWRYAQHSIDEHSRWTGFPYPWPHMTAVEGEDIIGGGMEYPMMTLISGYAGASDTSLHGVVSHELAHMWVPMTVGTDERRYGWMDEGTTSFNTSAEENEFYPGRRWELGNYQGYEQAALLGLEGEIMRWSDYQYTSYAYSIASYAKPATLLWTLDGLLGRETFLKAYHTFVRTWAFKHPKPWDLFDTFNYVSGRNLDWFWRTFYYQTWMLDQAVGSVTLQNDGTHIVVDDRGLAPMPARLTITLQNGDTLHREIPVDTWLSGARSAEIVLRTSSPVTKVEIDAEEVFPDVDRRNNTWERQ